MPEAEEKYTLLEAQKILARRECMTFDHTLMEFRAGDGTTPSIYCERCGDKWLSTDVLIKDGNEIKAVAWEEGVKTALHHAIRAEDGITLLLSVPNPYKNIKATS